MTSHAATLQKGQSSIKVGTRIVSVDKPYNKDKCIIVEDVMDTATRAMTNTVWMWVTQWGKQYGETKEAKHNEFKARFLLPEISKSGQNESLVQHIRDVYPMLTSEHRDNAIGMMVRTEWASFDDMHEAMDQFTKWALPLGIQLTDPDKHHKIKKLAMETGKTQTVKK